MQTAARVIHTPDRAARRAMIRTSAHQLRRRGALQTFAASNWCSVVRIMVRDAAAAAAPRALPAGPFARPVRTGLTPGLGAAPSLRPWAALGAGARRGAGPGPPRAGRTAPRALAWATTAAAAAVLLAGTVVTGSGPHAGDEHVPRTGLDP